MDNRSQPKRGRPRKVDEDATLDVAMQAYWQDDPADVSLNTICKLAKVSKPALYRVFGGEDGLMRAVLDRYAEQVLSEIFVILSHDTPLEAAFDALFWFASEDAKMATGCVFYKMRAGKHRLGPMTRERVEDIDAGAVNAFASYLAARRNAGDNVVGGDDALIARYLVEQIGLALTQRAAGENPAQIKQTLELALSAIRRP